MLDCKRQFIVVSLITVIAGWLRLSAVNFGLPDQLRPDEEHLVPRAIGIQPRGKVYNTSYPDAQRYLVRGVLYADATITGYGGDVHRAYAGDRESRAFSIARLTTAVMGAVTVPIIYLAAVPIYSPVAGIISSSILAASFIHVRDSKFAKTEVPSGFWLALSILTLLRIPVRGRVMDYALTGLFCGLAAATHYPSGTIAIGIFVAHLEARRREGKSLLTALFDWRIYVAGAVCLAVFAVINPHIFLDWKHTRQNYVAIQKDYQMWNHGNSPAGYGWPWLLGLGMPRGFGIEIEILLLLALLSVFLHRKPGTFALLAFVLACFLSLTGGHPQLEIRYLINPLLAMVLFAGVFVTETVIPLLGKIGIKRGPTTAVACVAALLIPSVVRDMQMNHLLNEKDTRTLAREWIGANIPEATTIGLIGGVSYGKPQLSPLYKIVSLPVPLTSTWSTDAPDWLVSDSSLQLSLWSRGLSETELADVNAKATLVFDVDPVRPGRPAPVFDPNDAFYVPFCQITSMNRPGPRIRIWRVH